MKMIQKAVVVICCSILCGAGLADSQLVIKNNTGMTLEVSGLVGANTSQQRFNSGSTTITATGDASGHIMLMTSATKPYADNIIIRSQGGQFQVADLYNQVSWSLNNNILTLNKKPKK